MEKVKYRLNDPRLAPRRTKLEIPGWAGKREPRADGSREQVWHCVPFSEGAQYGIELFYPTTTNCTSDQGRPIDTGRRLGPAAGRRPAVAAVPEFRRHFYTYQILLDLKVEKGMAIRTEPHPRFYTDPHRHRADRGAGADAELVADDVLLRVQGAGRGPHPYFQAERAVRADHRDPRGSHFRAREDGRGGIGRARTAGAAHLQQPAEAGGRGRNGPRRPTPCSTAPTGTCTARRRKRPGKAEAIG